MNQRLIGFFKYDLFPYVVCNEIDEIRERGTVFVKEVGTYKADAVICIMPYEEGVMARSYIKKIISEERKHTEEYRKSAIAKLVYNFPGLIKMIKEKK